MSDDLKDFLNSQLNKPRQDDQPPIEPPKKPPFNWEKFTLVLSGIIVFVSFTVAFFGNQKDNWITFGGASIVFAAYFLWLIYRQNHPEDD